MTTFKYSLYATVKKSLLLLILGTLGLLNAQGQCLTATNGLWPAATFNPTCAGTCTFQNIVTDGWTGEYSNVNVVVGNTYTFRSSVATDFITISNAAGTVAFTSGVSGAGGISWVSTVTGTVRFYTHLSAACNSNTANRTRSVCCVGAPPPSLPGDNCANPISIACGATVAGTTLGRPTAAVPFCVTANGTGGKVWYAFTGDGSNVTASLCTGTSYDSKLWVFSGPCATPVCVTGNDDGCGAQSVVTFPTTIGTTYYVVVGGFSTSEGAYSLNLTCTTPPPPFAPCSTIGAISACGVSTNAVNLGGTGLWDTYGGPFGVPGQESLFTFTPVTSGNYTITVTSQTGGWADFFFKNSTLGCNATGWTYIDDMIGPGTTAAFPLTAGITYYIMVDDEATDGYNINFTVDCPPTPPANDECATAISVSVNAPGTCPTGAVSGTTNGASDSGSGYSCFVGGPFQDVWYTFNSGSNTAIDLTMPTFPPTLLIEVYAGSCAGASVFCDFGFTATTNNIFTVTPNTDYFVKIGSETNTGNFTLCIQGIAPPVNPCSNIVPITSCGEIVSGSSNGPGVWDVGGGFACDGFAIAIAGQETVFSFTAPATGNYNFDIISAAVGSLDGIDFYYKTAGVCDNTGWSCLSGTSVVFDGGSGVIATLPLTAGVTYYFLADYENNASAASYSFRLVCPPVWTGAVSSDWNTGGNWNNGFVPAAGSNVTIPDVSPNFFPLIGTAVTVNNLTIASGATVDVAPGAGLVLDGTLDATAGVFTLQSDASGTAYLDDFTLGGTVLGPISVQRFNPLGVAGFRQLGTPVAMPNISGVAGFTPSGTPGFIIPDPSCNPSYVASNSPYGNWMQLVENGTVQFSCSQSLFQVLTGGGMTSGRGYYMDVAGNSTLTFTGAPNTGAVNFGLSHANTAVTNGWNMVSNPYPSPLAWETGNVPAGVDGIGKIWVTSGTYTGTFQDLDPNVAGTAVAIGQAFQVRVSTPGGTPSFSVDNGDRTVTPPTYLFAGNESMTLNIDILGGGFADLTKVRFIQGATNAYDAMYDSPKMLGNSNQPMVYTVWNGENMSTNSFAELLDVYTVALGVKAAAAGQHSLVFSNTDQFPASAFIYLEDTENGTWQDVRTNDTYTYAASAGINESRFKIHFYPPVSSNTADAGCETAGSVVLEEQAPASWNYVITDAQNQTVSSGQLEGTATVNGLAAGDYTLTLSEQASGYVAVETFTVNGPAQVTATALASVTVAEAGEEIQFTAQTQNANTYSWDFGDGNSSQDMNPVHLYNAAGTYAVTLTASGDVCQAVSSLGISVTGGTAGTEDAFAQQGVNMWNAGGTVFISFGETWAGKTVFTLYDAQGRRVMNTQFADAQGTLTVDCGMLAAGVYTAELAGNGRIVTRKTVMGIK